MYGAGGLFGDLPSKKNSSTKDSNVKDGEKTVNKKTAPQGTRGRVGTKSNVLLSFVPATLKRKKPPVKSTKEQSNKSTNTNTNTNTNNVNSSNRKKLRAETIAFGEAGIETTIISTETITIKTTTKNIDAQKKLPPTVVNIHGDSNPNNDTNGSLLPSAAAAAAAAATTTTTNTNTYKTNMNTTTRNEEIKSCTKINDPYDPFVPNDLLEYWEKQAATKQRERLERQTREAFERQKSIRKKIEDERSELQKSGDYTTLIARERERIYQQENHHDMNANYNNSMTIGTGVGIPGLGRGRGRGRGLSNLPAWLVEKQRKETEGATATGTSQNEHEGSMNDRSNINNNNNNNNDGRFNDSASP